MKKPFVAAVLAAALLSAPLATAQAATESAAPVAACVEYPIGAPGGCDFVQNILQLLSIGSSSLGGDSLAP